MEDARRPDGPGASLDVRIPNDQPPRAWTLWTTGGAALAGGLVLAFWGMDPAEPAAPPAPAPPAEPRAAPTPAEAIADAGPRPARPARGASGAQPEPPAEPPAELPEELPAEVVEEAAPSGPLHFQQGRVAYVRCDGVETRGGGCPRDEPLEEAVWNVLAMLPTCDDPPPQAGHADLRLDFEDPGRAPRIRWRDTFSDDVVRLDQERTVECVRAGLGGVRTGLDSARLLVSFRFALEAP